MKMEFTGKWASYDPYDLQLNIMPDGRVYADILELGEHGAQAKSYTEGDTLSFSVCGISAKLKPADDNKLHGECTYNGETKGLVLEKLDAEPGFLPYHHTEYDKPVEFPADFPVSLDKIVGRWKCEKVFNSEMSITNVDGRAYLLLSFDGQTKWIPHTVWIDSDAIVWQMNDSFHRGICILYPEETENGIELVGSYSQLYYGDLDNVVYKKLSDTPAEYSEKVSKVALPDKSRLDILREYAAYKHDSGVEAVPTEYVLHDKAPEELEKYGFGKYVEGKSGDELVFACFDFVCDHFKHYGMSGMPSYRTRSLHDFLEWCDTHENNTNCRGLSIMLSDILRYVGIRAEHVTCMPFEEPFDDCHVVVECILPSGERVMLDPTYHLYFRDSDGRYVSIERLREILIAGEELFPNAEAAYRGEVENGFALEEYREYMSKNTIRFSKSKTADDGNDEWESVFLFPVNYPIEAVLDPSYKYIRTDDTAFWK